MFCNNHSGIRKDQVTSKPLFQYLTDFFKNPARPATDDIGAYRDYVQQHGPSVDVVDGGKCNEKAGALRREGNRLYLKKRFKPALEKYNESICWALGDSEDLALGYANRSAIYYEQGEYELCLANIALARKHRYPELLQPKLQTREQNCKQKIATGHSRCNYHFSALDFKAKVNDKIPAVAKDIIMKQMPECGRGLVANRAFKVGEVILHEQPIMAAIDTQVKYLNCDFCSNENFHSLIPCPKCPSVMFCNEECLENGQKYIHRFECGISEKLHHIRSDDYLGIRMFFYGLSLFDGNVGKMIKFCKSRPKTEVNPLKLDFKNHDRLKEFELFHRVENNNEGYCDEEMYETAFRFLTAIYYKIYMTQPQIKSIFVQRRYKNFMLSSLLDYMRTAHFMAIGPGDKYTEQLFSFASLCNHSCDPNTLSLYWSGQLKFVVLRPISKNEEILISYGPLYCEHTAADRHYLTTRMFFECICDACDPISNAFTFKCMVTELLYPALADMHMCPNPAIMLLTDKLRKLRNDIEVYSFVHPRDDFYAVLDDYRQCLTWAFVAEIDSSLRAKHVR
ncbi:uncharacterized protein LOC131692688 [Topomyia yanbarensis]|uniref:uncharacterized protein LOC131692688 n=1 Tax=Topomyia yanbarensis TaxID=2498891 RepID=UPI00273CBFE1|nr:uncharacterized protein LOC131692688 [Topomyia yanbarensis]